MAAAYLSTVAGGEAAVKSQSGVRSDLCRSALHSSYVTIFPILPENRCACFKHFCDFRESRPSSAGAPSLGETRSMPRPDTESTEFVYV